MTYKLRRYQLKHKGETYTIHANNNKEARKIAEDLCVLPKKSKIKIKLKEEDGI